MDLTNKLIYTKTYQGIKIISPFGEFEIKFDKFDLECFLESCRYWGIRPVDIDKYYAEGFNAFEKAIHENIT